MNADERLTRFAEGKESMSREEFAQLLRDCLQEREVEGFKAGAIAVGNAASAAFKKIADGEPLHDRVIGLRLASKMLDQMIVDEPWRKR